MARHYNLRIRDNDFVNDSTKHDISPIANRTRSKTSTGGAVRTLSFMDGRCATPADQTSSFDLSTIQESLPTSQNEGSESSSYSSQDSPLGRKFRKLPGIPETSRTGANSERESSGDEKSSQTQLTLGRRILTPAYAANDMGSDSEQSTEASSEVHSIGNASAAAILYPPTEGKQIVNMSLLLFMGALCAHCPLATAEWTPARKAFQIQLNIPVFKPGQTGTFVRKMVKKLKRL